MNVSANLCFTGHRPSHFGGDGTPLAVAVRDAIRQVIREAYSSGFRRFITGMAQGVDTWAAETVIEFKRTHEDAKLIAAVPHMGQYFGWPADAVARWENIVRLADQRWDVGRDKRIGGLEMLECARWMVKEPARFGDSGALREHLLHRNRWMVDRSARVVAVWDGSASGTGYTVRYAVEKGREVVRIDPAAL